MLKKIFLVILLIGIGNYHNTSIAALTIDSRSLNVNVSECTVGESGVNYWNFGSDHYKIILSNDKNCTIHVGGETENPSWDGFLRFECTIPRDLGMYNVMNKEFCIERSVGSYLMEKNKNNMLYILLMPMFIIFVVICYLNIRNKKS